jgi:hypothetical protein
VFAHGSRTRDADTPSRQLTAGAVTLATVRDAVGGALALAIFVRAERLLGLSHYSLCPAACEQAPMARH